MEDANNKRWIIIYSITAIVLLVINYILDLPVFDHWEHFESLERFSPFVKNLMIALFFISLIFLIGKVVTRIVNKQNYLEGDKYNLNRIVRFLSIVFSLIIAASFMFQNLLAAAVSFGLITLVLGFALQQPITSFIAWIYLIFRRSYLVGDRIQIKNFRGDVVEIGYLDTSILECNGDYLGNDRSSGRVVRFPNSLILREEIINYSGPQTPFIWNETALQVAFTSDMEFVEKTLLEVAIEDFKTRYPKYVSSPRWEPAVYFRVNERAWMEAVISYPVMPRDTTIRRNAVLKLALIKLNAAPSKVQFPEGSLR